VKLSFIPAELHLDTDPDGQFKVTLQGTEIFRSRSSAKALKKFNELKKELESNFPAHDELSVEEKKELLQRALGDDLVKANSVRKRKKSTARSTRTFG
jgi:hypothetical protein